MEKIISSALIILLGWAGNSFATTVIATETARAEYEMGKLSHSGKGEFGYRFDIDEKNGTAKVTEYTRLKDKSIIDWPAEYHISYVDDGVSISGSTLIADKKKGGQKVLCLVGNPGTLATEVIMIGDNYFEYVKASSGRFYLASGTVQKSISAGEDIDNQFKNQ